MYPFRFNRKLTAVLMIAVFVGSFLLPNWASSIKSAQAATNITVVDVRVASGVDDVEQRLNDGTISTSSTDLELINDPGTAQRLQSVGIRFTGVNVPRGAVISKAYLEFQVDETSSEDTSLVLRAEAADNAAAFTTTANNVTNRSRTSAAINWNNLPAWSTVSAKVQSPDITPVLQEVVSRSGWNAGGSLVLFVDGSGRRVVKSYEKGSSSASLLHIEYTTTSLPQPTQVPTTVPTQVPTTIPTIPPSLPTPTTAAITPTSLPTVVTTPTTAAITPTSVPTVVATATSQPQPVQGYFVSTTGSDSSTGTFNTPWRTIQKAVNAAPDGATVYVRAGDYAGFKISRKNLTISGYQNEIPSILNDGVTKYTVQVLNTSGIKLTNLAFHDNWMQYGAGIYIEGSTNISVKNSAFYDHQGFGVVTKNVNNVTVDGNDLYRNGNAIEVRYNGTNLILSNNKIHHNFREIDSGRGSMGINFYKTTGSITAIGNLLWENHSNDLANPEGSAFEIYAGGYVNIIGNTIWDNETVLETGTSGGAACSNITFNRNFVYRGSRHQGLILRCASDSLFAQNVFDGLDEYVFYLTHYKGTYGGSIENLKIFNNISVNGRVYSIEGTIPASVQIDYNLVYNPGSTSSRGNYLAYVEGKGNTMDFSTFKQWTGYDQHSVNKNPVFVNPTIKDYHLLGSSPAINIGINLGEPFTGTAPDAGAFEFTP